MKKTLLTLAVLGTSLVASTSAQASNSDFFANPPLLRFDNLYLDFGYFHGNSEHPTAYGEKGVEDYDLRFAHYGFKIGVKKFFADEDSNVAFFVATHADFASSELLINDTLIRNNCGLYYCASTSTRETGGTRFVLSGARSLGLEAGVISTVASPLFLYTAVDANKILRNDFKAVNFGIKVGLGSKVGESTHLYLDVGFQRYKKTPWKAAETSSLYEYDNVNHKIKGLKDINVINISFGISL